MKQKPQATIEEVLQNLDTTIAQARKRKAKTCRLIALTPVDWCLKPQGRPSGRNDLKFTSDYQLWDSLIAQQLTPCIIQKNGTNGTEWGHFWIGVRL